MAFRKITEADMEGKGNMGQPDTPGVSTAEMQRILDQLPREVIAPIFNQLIDALAATDAARNIGAESVTGGSTTVQGHINSLKNPHHVNATQVGSYTKAQTDQAIAEAVFASGSADMTKAEYGGSAPGVVKKSDDSGKLGGKAPAAYCLVDSTPAEFAHQRVQDGGVYCNNITGPETAVLGRVKLTSSIEPTDTWKLNGTLVSAFAGAEKASDVMSGQPYSGKWVGFMNVSSGSGRNLYFFNGGGRVTVSGLSPNVLAMGKTVTVKSGSKVIQTATGVLDGYQLVAVGHANSWGYQDVWMKPTALDSRYAAVSGNYVTIQKAGTYYIYSVGCTYEGNSGALGTYQGVTALSKGDRFSAYLPWRQNGNGSEMACLFLAYKGLE